MARIAEVLGRTGYAAAFAASAEQVKAAFNATFLDSARGVYRGDSRDRVYRQSHNALALAFGLVPADLLARVADNLAADVSARGDHLNTGALATKYLLPVLTEHGHGELAYRVATQTTAPSWGFWVAQGATSLWEMWTNPRSVGHAFLGTVDDWFFKDLAGLRVAGRAYERVDVKPHVLGDLTSAEAGTRTPFGRVSVAWRRLGGGRLALDVDVPVGVTARVHVPATRA
jgi:alpha-L-rhamnosidase